MNSRALIPSPSRVRSIFLRKISVDRLFTVLAILVVAASSSACSGIDPAVLETILGPPTTGTEAPLDEATVDRGLREALRLGTRRAVDRTSAVDGFLANELIRLYLPEDLQRMADTLRQIGFRRQVDQLEVTMNRAAERASGEAVDVFIDAISAMSLRDVFGILRGGETAATDYLYSRTHDSLRGRFEPIVETKMSEVGLYQQYNRLSATYNALPLGQKPAVDLTDYITQEALDGLFEILGEEERRIREDPIARTTELLRRVFR
ncbi:MAG: DUF4197 domain-containing protein [Deltaproteobacteria bacterium]|nr:DUF4197 domain-containing protein [Deltaproteobacteria bacterium]